MLVLVDIIPELVIRARFVFKIEINLTPIEDCSINATFTKFDRIFLRAEYVKIDCNNLQRWKLSGILKKQI
ncbi:hypothetical protein RN001_004395 [Aquatica leii]|uniref:Uncharacterized protein n=1 Tax=Aquatica leii TaxID=1421715 RepID=A0AAN7PIB1_9COLE|nr:hypothetical protein RN001_004395 [Aquatica leii]